MPLFTICNISLRCPKNVSVKFQLKMPHRSFIILFWKWLFWVKAETYGALYGTWWWEKFSVGGFFFFKCLPFPRKTFAFSRKDICVLSQTFCVPSKNFAFLRKTFAFSCKDICVLSPNQLSSDKLFLFTLQLSVFTARMFTMERFIEFYFELGLNSNSLQCLVQGMVLGHSETLTVA